MNRIRGLDSIRFVCALWVVVGHIGLPQVFGTPEHGVMHLLEGIYNSLINGPAAVIVFFLISGLCIHYPHRHGKPIHLPSFYTRRLIRISLPLLLAIVVGAMVGVHFSALDAGIFWSLVAEIIYYLIYPLLLRLHSKFGWKPLILVSFLASYAVVLTQPGAGNYPSFGHAFNWVLGLPCWLLGCLIAERSDQFSTKNAHNIWLYRGLIFAASWVVTMLRWHLPHLSIGFPWSLNIFALLAYVWLIQEIIFFRNHEPKRLLEWAGAWSYSLYLVHLQGATIGMKAAAAVGAGSILTNLTALLVSLIIAYLFYRIAEHPSHLIAVNLSARFKKDVKIPTPEMSPIERGSVNES